MVVCQLTRRAGRVEAAGELGIGSVGVDFQGFPDLFGVATHVTELPSNPKIKQQSSITNTHFETGHFHIKSMPICDKFGAASAAGWGAGAAIFSPVGRVVLLHRAQVWLSSIPFHFFNPNSVWIDDRLLLLKAVRRWRVGPGIPNSDSVKQKVSYRVFETD